MHLDFRLENIAAVGAGGVVGALVRWGSFGTWEVEGRFPLEALLVNLIGCLLMGWFVGRRMDRGLVGLVATTGFCGGLTSFSAFAVDAARLLDQGDTAMAFGYVAATSVGALVVYAFARSAAEVRRGDSSGRGRGGRGR